MEFKTVENVKDIAVFIGNFEWDTFHTSTNDKHGNKLVKFWKGKNCVLIVCVKGTKDFNEDHWDQFHDDLLCAIDFKPEWF